VRRIAGLAGLAGLAFAAACGGPGADVRRPDDSRAGAPPDAGFGTVGVHITTSRTRQLCEHRKCTMAELLACDASDLGSSPWKGPAFDARGELVRELPERYVVAYALGYAKIEHLPELDAPTLAAVAAAEATPGLLGYRMGASQRCGGAATLSMWVSEEAMEEFLYSDAHLEATMTVPHAFYGNASLHYVRRRDAGLPTFADGEARLRAELANPPR
jgi:hypothetical protein